jgi:hypothetical protein
MLPPARAAALIEATSGDAVVAVAAVGEEAKLINAAMPFASGPVGSARPFDLGGDSLDHRRALLCLTQAVYYEAGFEPLAGRRAVAQVVLNRMRHPAYPKSVCSVVYQRNSTPVCQFSFVCDGALYRAPQTGAWNQARDIAAAALAGYVETAVGSATHYHADYVAPRWAPLLSKVVKLGTHIFYRWPGAWGQPAAFTGRYIGEPNDPPRCDRHSVPRRPGPDRPQCLLWAWRSQRGRRSRAPKTTSADCSTPARAGHWTSPNRATATPPAAMSPGNSNFPRKRARRPGQSTPRLRSRRARQGTASWPRSPSQAPTGAAHGGGNP